jgi:hypothetical protein
MANPFADLIPSGGKSENPFADLIPAKSGSSFKERFAASEDQPKEDKGAADSFKRGAVQGATFNFADEAQGLYAAGGGDANSKLLSVPGLGLLERGVRTAVGAVRYATGGEDAAKRYALTAGQERKLDEAAQDQHPVANFAGNVTGGLAASAVVPGGAAIRAGTLAQRAAQGAKAGGAYGALAGAGSGDDLASRTTGAVVGGVVGGVTGGIVNGAIGPRLPASGVTGQQVAEAAERIGVPVSRGVVSDSGAVQGLTQASRQLPLLGNRIDDALTATNTGLEEAVNKSAAQLSGTSGSRDAVGAAARASLERAIDKADQRADAAFTSVRRAINPDAEVQVAGNVVQDLDKIVQNRLASGGTGVPIEGLQNAVELLTRPQGATFNGLQRARSEVGKAIKWDARNGGFITGDLKQAYGALSDAMEDAVYKTAKGNPNDALNLLNKANTLFGKVTGETKELSRFMANGSDERIVDRIISYASDRAGRGDIAKLNLLRRSMDPAEWQQVSAMALQRMGQNSAGDFSPAFFVKNYQTMSSAAKDSMFGKAGGGVRQAIDDIAMVSKRMNDVGKSANFSNTGRATLAGLGLAGASYTFSDPLGAAETALKTAAIGVPVVALLSRPATASSMAKWSKAYEYLVTKPSNGALAGFNIASRDFAHKVGDATGIRIDPNTFLKSLQGAKPAGAQEEQH